jgi:regulator of sigma E protease
VTGFALVVLLGTLVLFHELGHFSAAKLFRIKVDEFAFGFGPKWIRLFRRGDTEYTIHPVPLGGFVKLAGMEPGEEDVPNGFNTKPVWQRMIVYFAGPFMSFVLAVFVFSTMGLTVGLPISGEIVNRVELVQPKSVAEKAGLRTADVVISINGKRIASGTEMVTTIHNSAGKALTLIVQRDEKQLTIHATPKAEKLGKKTVGLLGFIPTPKLQRVGVGESIRFGALQTEVFAVGMVQSIFSRHVKDAIGGPIAIADATQTSVKRGIFGFLQLMAILSLSLGVVNLIPIPILDGGAIMLLFGERIKGRRLAPRTIEVAQKIGLALIAALFITIMYLDLSRLASNQLFR